MSFARFVALKEHLCCDHSKQETFLICTGTEPLEIVIIIAVIIGCTSLLSGLVLLCLVSKSLEDRTSEAISLMGIGFLLITLTSVTWRLTQRDRFNIILNSLHAEHI